MISRQSVDVLLQLIPTVNPMTTPDPVATTQVLVTAQQELIAYANTLNGRDDLREPGPTDHPSAPVVGDSGDGCAEPLEDGMASPGVDSVSV